MRALVLAAALAAGSSVYCPGLRAQNHPDAVNWLRKIYAATDRLSYTGTFVYQQGEQVETSRLTRLVDASGVHERLEPLDGTPREIIRFNEEVKCYIPSTMTLKVDRQLETQPFPAMRADVNEITQYYTVRKAETERIAGHDCQAIVLEPRDKFRYGHKLWADVATGMLVKAKTLNEKGEVVEQFAFSELQIGGRIDRDKVKSRFAGKGRDWQVEHSGFVETNVASSGWGLGTLPPGYRKVTELKRRVGASADVRQIVLSDGLAAVSIFIEPLGAKAGQPQLGPARQGAFNVYTRQVDEFLVTVIGEVPAESVRWVAQNVEHRRPQ
jgi:sigma-E factor negative regulatory protein RseB